MEMEPEMPHNTSPTPSLLNRANQAFRQGAFDEAVRLYLQNAEAFPELAQFYAFNVALSRNYAQRWYSSSNARDGIRRAVVFATYSSESRIEAYVLHYLRQLRKVAEHIVVVGDFALEAGELAKLDGLAEHAIFERHGEYDFGSYKRGRSYLAARGILDQVDELILCNDSCYGPLQGFEWMFREMAGRQVDFWGLTQNSEFGDHVQSYFVVLSRKVFSSVAFRRFIHSVERQDSVHEVIQKYELGLTRTLAGEGFSWDTFINPRSPGMKLLLTINTNPTVFPNFMAEAGAQLVKVKALKDAACNADGVHTTLGRIARENLDLLQLICAHQSPPAWCRLDVPFFSVILPAFNRLQSIDRAIDSLLAQEFDNYELIVIDDGSTDNTSAWINERYKGQIEQDRLRLIRYEKNTGVSAARNVGLAAAKGDWIAYLDSDNTVERNFLKVFVEEIQKTGELDCCYAMMRRSSTQQEIGFPFDYQQLLSENYIDLGVVVHRTSLIKQTGDFDTNLRRLVDWDFLIRTMHNRRVGYIPQVVMNYWDDAAIDRISVRESYDLALRHMRQKNGLPFLVSTVLVPNGNLDDLLAAINYACTSRLSHRHEVLVFDNSGSNETWAAIERHAQRHPSLKAAKQGISVSPEQNFLNTTGAARGDFVRVLLAGSLPAGEDRLQEHVDYLINTPECPQTADSGQVHPDFAKTLQGDAMLQFVGTIYRRHVLEKLLR